MNSAVSGSSKINKFNPQNYKGFKKFVDKDAWWVLILVGSLFLLFMVPLILGLKVFFHLKSNKKGFWTSFKAGVVEFFYSFIFILLHHNPIVENKDMDDISWKKLVRNKYILSYICYLYIPIILSLIVGFRLHEYKLNIIHQKNKYKTKHLLISFWGFFVVLVVWLLLRLFVIISAISGDDLVNKNNYDDMTISNKNFLNDCDISSKDSLSNSTISSKVSLSSSIISSEGSPNDSHESCG
jgi:hypothetical protein